MNAFPLQNIIASRKERDEYNNTIILMNETFDSCPVRLFKPRRK